MRRTKGSGFIACDLLRTEYAEAAKDVEAKQAALRDAELKRDTIRQLLEKGGVSLPTENGDKPTKRKRRWGMTEQIVRWVRDHPSLHKDTVIAQFLETLPETERTEKKKLAVINTVGNLIRDGDLRKDDQEKLTVNE